MFKREVEITKRFLEKVNIEVREPRVLLGYSVFPRNSRGLAIVQVPVVRKPVESTGATTQQQEEAERSSRAQEVQKPASLDLNEKRKKAQNLKEMVQTTPTSSSVSSSPKLARHQKVRELEGSRTPSPSSVSRKSSFASLFKVSTDRSFHVLSLSLAQIFSILLVNLARFASSPTWTPRFVFVEDPLALSRRISKHRVMF